jgi:O-antigen/teichoic acid export membrane protein
MTGIMGARDDDVMNPRSWLERLRLVWRLRPFDVSTVEGRARERHRRAFWIVTTSFVAKGVSAAAGLISVPLTLGYLGKQQYGLWVALGSLLTWMALGDFGMARGLQNHLAEAYGHDDRDGAARHMSTAFFALLTLAAIAGVLFVPALYLVPWARLLRITEPALIGELRPALAALMLVFLAQFPLNVVSQAYAAFQRSHTANLFAMVGSGMSVVLLLVVIRLRLGLPWLIFAASGSSIALSIVNFWYLARQMPQLRPRLSRVSRRTLRELIEISAPMLLFQIGSLFINEAQIILIARRINMAAVTDWSLFFRVFQVPVLIIAMIEAPYAPMLREAFVRGDSRWFRRTFYGLLTTKFGLTLVGTAAYLVGGNWLVRLMSNGSISFNWTIWALGGVALIAGCWNGTYNVLFMAVNRLWLLVGAILGNAAVTLGLTYWLAPMGMSGLLIAYAAYSLLVTSWLLPVFSRAVFDDAAKRARDEAPGGAAVHRERLARGALPGEQAGSLESAHS